MLRTGHADTNWFSSQFLAQTAVIKIVDLIASVKGSLGTYESLESTPAKFVAHFAKGLDDIEIRLDVNDRIDGLHFRATTLTAASLDDALRARQPSSGTIAYVIAEEGRSERAALRASDLLAIGSAFKLAVLNALRDEIAKGRRHWTDVVALKQEWKSLPTGIVQNWPVGTPLTLATLAAEMISISDNTAADALIRIVGPKALEPYAGTNQPFLTTREMLTMTSELAGTGLGAYRTAMTPAARAAALVEVNALPLPTLGQLSGRPHIAVEWYYSARDLCRLMAHICFAATINDERKALHDLNFEVAYSSVLRVLESQ